MYFTPFNRLLFFLHSSTSYWPVSRLSRCILLSSHFLSISAWFFFFFQWLYLLLFISQFLFLFLSYCISFFFFVSFSFSILILSILSILPIFPVIPVIPSIPIFLSFTLFLLGHQGDVWVWKASNLLFPIVFLNLTSIDFNNITNLNVFMFFISDEWGTTRISTYKNNHFISLLSEIGNNSVNSDFNSKLFSFFDIFY